MYRIILVAIDGSSYAEKAMRVALALAERGRETQLIGCHVYAAAMHRDRFERMEPGLPQRYHGKDEMAHLRATHDRLISDGMKSIAEAYLAPLEKQAQEKGLRYTGLTVEGRHYVELLQAVRGQQAELLVMGAWGQGRVTESLMGSVVERTLLSLGECDALVVKGDRPSRNRPIVVGIDGSAHSYAALRRAAELGEALHAPVEAVAVYDPFFHSTVFRAVSEVLPREDAQRFNFPAQELLHDEIIDGGLVELYREGLKQAAEYARKLDLDIHTELLAGKVYPKLHHYAAMREAGLVVVGRWGWQWDPVSLIGSNALNLVRLSTSNVLVVASSQTQEVPGPSRQGQEQSKEMLQWLPEAEAHLKRVPFFARQMARRAVERYAREHGLTEITAEIVRGAAGRFGMGR